MAAPVTAKYEHLAVEISSDGTTWTKICGMDGYTINRNMTMDTTEVPADCVDESLPFVVEKQPRSRDFSISGTGVWAQSSHETMLDWHHGAILKHCRVHHVNAASGDTEYETGRAYLTDLVNSRTKGKRVDASIKIDFDGEITRTAKA